MTGDTGCTTRDTGDNQFRSAKLMQAILGHRFRTPLSSRITDLLPVTCKRGLALIYGVLIVHDVRVSGEPEMSKSEQYRQHVEKLIAGDYHPIHLIKLILWLREQPGDSDAIKEIGDFVAHAEKRNKGIATETLRQNFSFVKYRVFEGFDRNNLPDYIIPFIWSVFGRREPSMIANETGLPMQNLLALLRSALGKIGRDPSTGKLHVQKDFDKDETTLMNYLIRLDRLPSIFNSVVLFSQMKEALLSFGLLQEEEIEEFDKVYPSLSLFALEAMHRCSIDLTNGDSASLSIAMDPSGKLLITAITYIAHDGRAYELKINIFRTDLKAKDWCSDRLVTVLNGEDAYNAHIVLTPEPRLDLI